MAKANDSDFEKNIENLKTSVRKSFAQLYAALKARELKTLRQIDALCKQCQNDKDLKRNCVQNIQISYDNESTLLDNITNYGVIDFEKLNFDSSTFTMEDYISPNDDHLYSYKTLDEITSVENEDLEAIEEAAIQEVIRTENCVCTVNIHKEDVSKKFRDLELSPIKKNSSIVCIIESKDVEKEIVAEEEEKSDSPEIEMKKVDPTDDWLNTIKSQTETEPSQVTDVMEHSTITCS